ncbi:hypothetical protein DB347_01275 [Opitutaceae bacterium EW11]|nr:hypothetical protein DB347_01275 [Opitutaceae bacterium EW11]
MNRKSDAVRLSEPQPVRLIEEAIHLLRTTDLASWSVYYAGTGAWVLAFLFFWARTTWFAPSEAQVAWFALGLVLLFAGMKAAQSEFCARLLARRLGAAPPSLSLKRLLRLSATQLRVQAWGAIAVPISLVLSFPFGWVYAFFQNATVLGLENENGQGLTAEAAIEAKRWPKQNHLGLLFLSVIASAALLNVAAAFYVLPWVANRFFGIQNLFGFTGWWGLNTTFLASVCALTWLAVDPLVKAFYVLRVFYGRSQRSGEDLQVELAAAARARRAGLVLAALLMITFVVDRPLRGASGEPAEKLSTGTVVPAKELDGAIDRVLAQPEFEWRLRPALREKSADTAEEGSVKRFVRQSFEALRSMARSVFRFIERVARWLRDLFPTSSGEKRPAPGGGLVLLRVLLYGLILLAVGLLVALLVVIVRQRRQAPVRPISARPVSARPDLTDDSVQAAQLPADGWLALAREQMARGEWRLALRALYLATLARLAAEGLLSLGKSKTNLDYERELRRRAAAFPEVVRAFAERRREFESVWYGRAEAAGERVKAWADEFGGAVR